ncbi:surface carbohydrate biosynthesis protein [Flavobacterium sp. NRK F7]|uniref:surface carbohydrate biosynthesis protein n=1 Tax=Flavobacterium sp. NRK F7 TaxID=2954930 RepID=UPI0020916D78|nr:surface carbohydrate biosynthesis protein [Flavobacterium sp. NRK F7]MCO6164200.1 hypothetical protein [Flavobacterium sp. NRK F7]
MNLSEKKVLFITTYKARDFEGNALVGYYLYKNYAVESQFIHGYSVKQEIEKLKPAVLVMDHLVWDHKKELAFWANSVGVKVVLLFTEGYYKDISSFDKIFGHPNADKLNVTKYLVWNNQMVKRVKDLDYSDEFSQKMIVTGSPRFDFLTNTSLSSFGFSKLDFIKKYDLQDYKEIITYMSTTPYQGYSFEKFYSRYKKKANFSDEIIRNFYDDNQKQFRNHTTIIKKLAVSNPEIVFFYKSHPSEAYISNYETVFEGVNNIKLISNENVRPFLQYSNLVIQRNCTTALESWLLGKPVVQLDDADYNSKTYKEHLDYSYLINNLEELDAFIKSKEYQNWNVDNVTIFLEGIFGKLDGLAYKRVADEIVMILEKWNETDQTNLENNLLKYRKEVDTRFMNRVKDFLRLDRKTSLRPKVYIKRLFRKKKNNSNEVNIEPNEVHEFYNKLNDFV